MNAEVETLYAIRRRGGWCEVTVLLGTDFIVASSAVRSVYSGTTAFNAWFREQYEVEELVHSKQEAIRASQTRRDETTQAA